jgi:N-methylhydantoinase A
VCYGRGGEDPTVTDCDAILGYLNPRYFLGGRAPLDVDSAYRAFEDKVARPLGMSVTEAAAAIYRLVNSMIYDLLHKVTVERGLDPRKFALFSFGGTAGMHVSAYGEALGVRCIVVPHSASVHGAFGLVTSDVVHEAMASFPMRVPADPSQVNEIFRSLEEKVVGQLLKEGFSPEEISVHRSVDMRYRRQVHVVTVPVPGRENLGATDMERVVDEFERLYRTKYGPESAFREAGIDLVAFRLRASGTVRKPEIAVSDAVGEADASGAVVEVRPAYVDLLGRMETVPGYDFELLRPGHRVQGPAIIWTPITTVVISPGQAAAVDRFKNLVIAREEVLLA